MIMHITYVADRRLILEGPRSRHPTEFLFIKAKTMWNKGSMPNYESYSTSIMIGETRESNESSAESHRADATNYYMC